MSVEQHWGNHGRDQDGEALMFACGIGHRHGTFFTIRDMGQKIYNFGIKPTHEKNYDDITRGQFVQTSEDTTSD